MSFLQSTLGITLPVVQAPMAGAQDEALAIAVAAAGGLGSMPCALLDAAQLERALQTFASLRAPVNLNFFCHELRDPDAERERHWLAALAPYYREAGIEPPPAAKAIVRRPIDAATVEVLEGFRPRIVSFHFGLPPPALLARIRAWGALVLASATTIDEGRWLQANGADVVIAQGNEAGGHRGHFLSPDLALQTSTHDLVAALVAGLSVPVIAAGGIGDGRAAQRMFDLGATAVQAGTAYLLCPEATTTAVHRAALRGPADTTITNLLTGRPARGLVNRLIRDLGPLSDLAPDFPWAAPALAPLRLWAEAQGRDDFSPLWSGTTRPRHDGTDAATITRELAG
jgi:nitronate monooxygenase